MTGGRGFRRSTEQVASDIALVKELQKEKVPIMAIGSQAHLNVSISFKAMDRTLAELGSLGLPIHITELDINSASGGQRNTRADIGANAEATGGGLIGAADQKLTEAYAAVFQVFLKYRESVKIVTFWGVTDAVSWRSLGRPLLFDGNNQPSTLSPVLFDRRLREADSLGRQSRTRHLPGHQGCPPFLPFRSDPKAASRPSRQKQILAVLVRGVLPRSMRQTD